MLDTWPDHPDAEPWDDEPLPLDFDELLAWAERQCATREYYSAERLIKQWIRRDHPLIRALKAKYKHRCQFPGCGIAIETRSGERYCEVGHIRPVARGGEALRVNLLVLCPNHHKMIDYGDLKIEANNRTVLKGTLNGKRFTIKR